jgi:transcriptional regulator with XRE-family HTH domain
MKYSHRSNYRKTCPHDPQTRAQLGSRLHYARIRLGWSVEDAGKYFQVTDRTWHNWENGSHRIPYAVYKLLRVLARLELPGKAWAGWRLEGDVLITPEGRQITPQDGSWWSLLVRRAAGFDAAYNEAATLRKLLIQVKNTVSDTASASGEAAALPGPDAVGLVPYKTNRNSDFVVKSERHHNDVTMTSWPILYDFPTPLTLPQGSRPITSGSASTPSSALPWTPTCEARENLLRPEQCQQRLLKGQSKPAPISPKWGIQSQSSPEPKSKPSMSATRPNENGSLLPDEASAGGGL